MSTKYTTNGVIFIHSVTPPLQKHVEWALTNVLGYEVHFDWTGQPAMAGMNRAEFSWTGDIGMGALLATSIRGWEHLRYEITEDPTPVSEGGRWSATPALGIFYAQTDLAGNVVIPENRIRSAIERSEGNPAELRKLVDLALGQAWDDELEPFRYAGAGAPVRWLHRVS